MYIQNLELKNFGSYRGSHEFDFTTETGRKDMQFLERLTGKLLLSNRLFGLCTEK